MRGFERAFHDAVNKHDKYRTLQGLFEALGSLLKFEPELVRALGAVDVRVRAARAAGAWTKFILTGRLSPRPVEFFHDLVMTQVRVNNGADLQSELHRLRERQRKQRKRGCYEFRFSCSCVDAATGKCIGGINLQEDVQQLLKFLNISPEVQNAVVKDIPEALEEIVMYLKQVFNENPMKLLVVSKMIQQHPKRVFDALKYDVEQLPAGSAARAIMRQLVASAEEISEILEEVNELGPDPKDPLKGLKDFRKAVELAQRYKAELDKMFHAFKPLNSYYNSVMFFWNVRDRLLNGKLAKVLPGVYDIAIKLLSSRTLRSNIQKLSSALGKVNLAVDGMMNSAYGLRVRAAFANLNAFLKSPEGNAMIEDVARQVLPPKVFDDLMEMVAEAEAKAGL